MGVISISIIWPSDIRKIADFIEVFFSNNVLKKREKRVTFLDALKNKFLFFDMSNIKTKKDLCGYLRTCVKDKVISDLIADVIENVGRDSYIQFKQGGNGQPYKVEYQDLSKFSGISVNEITSQINKLKEMQAQINSVSEREFMQQKIAESCGGLATIWINVTSQEEFSEKCHLLNEAYRRAIEVLNVNYKMKQDSSKNGKYLE